MGFFRSRKSAGQKRRQEREKSEKENIQRSTDSGLGSSEEGDGNNELGAPRDITPAENRSQIDQSAAQHDSQSTQPTKKRKLSLEEKHAKLDEYISSEESHFTCFATDNGLNNFANAIRGHVPRCSKKIGIKKPINSGNIGLSSTLLLHCECGWEKYVNTVGDKQQRENFDKQFYGVLTILGLVASKMDSFLRLMNFGGLTLNGASVGVDSESQKNMITRETVQGQIIDFKNFLALDRNNGKTQNCIRKMQNIVYFCQARTIIPGQSRFTRYFHVFESKSGV